ncbi:hypothetical protein ACVXZZ_02525 [Staphylococcus aureus]
MNLIEEKAQQFINHSVSSVEDAIKGAEDIIAEQISEIILNIEQKF